MKKILFVSVIAALFLCSCTPVKNQETKKESAESTAKEETAVIAVAGNEDELLLDDGEDGLYWNAVKNDWAEYGNRYMVTEFSKEADLSDEWVKEGSNSIKFVYGAMPEDKDGTAAHYYCTDLIESDWTGFNKLTMSVNNPSSEEVVFQFYTKSGDNWQWSDTEAMNIPNGEHDIEFDISTRGAANKNHISEMGFVIYHVHTDNCLYIDNVKLLK